MVGLGDLPGGALRLLLHLARHQDLAIATAIRTQSAMGTYGAIASNSAAASATVAAMGPRWSSVGDSGNTPRIGTAPKVGFSPTQPE